MFVPLDNLVVDGVYCGLGDTMERELVTHEVLEHILRTMLQVVSDAYYRAGYLTAEHTLLEIQKNALEKAILALQHATNEKSAEVEIIEIHAND